MTGQHERMLPPGSRWISLSAFLESLEARIGPEAWKQFKGSLQRGEISCQGQLQNVAEAFPPRWTGFFARFGDDGKNDQPDGDDFLFDRQAAHEAGVQIPYHRMTNVLVEREALERLWPATAAMEVHDAPGPQQPPPAATNGTRPLRNRPGPTPVKTNNIMTQMIAEYAGRPNDLQSQKQEALRSAYPDSAGKLPSRDTVEKARKSALDQLRQNSDKTPITDK